MKEPNQPTNQHAALPWVDALSTHFEYEYDDNLRSSSKFIGHVLPEGKFSNFESGTSTKFSTSTRRTWEGTLKYG